MKRGEVWLVSLDPGTGHEQMGTRTVLVLSPESFNNLTRVPIVAPITTGGAFVRNAGFAVSLSGVGTQTTGVIRCDQSRPVDLLSRRARRLETLPSTVMEEVMAKIVMLFE
jgi:mRNA interferase ChpB